MKAFEKVTLGLGSFLLALGLMVTAFTAGCELRIPVVPVHRPHCDKCCEKCGCDCCCKSCADCPKGCCPHCGCQQSDPLKPKCPKEKAGLEGGACPDCSKCHE